MQELTLERLWFAVRGYRPEQVLIRLLSPLLYPLRKLMFELLSLKTSSVKVRANPHFTVRLPPALKNVLSELRFQRAHVLNESLSFEEDLWQAVEERGYSPLWKFNAHYHEFLLAAMRDASIEGDVRLVCEVIDSLIKQFNKPGWKTRTLAWHPYVISRRVSVWLEILNWPSLPEPLRLRMMENLQKQVLWLGLNLELDLGGNHLWENYKALTLAANFEVGIGGTEFWSVRLLGAIKAQLLESGEHVERSPMYQAILIEGLRQVITTMPAQISSGAEIESYADKMQAFLRGISAANGRYPLFSDSTYDAPLLRAGPSLRSKDYIRNETKTYLQIVDIGMICAPHLPGHSHADLGTFEVFADGDRIILDPGTSEYTGSLRQVQRSSAAHNLFTVCDEVIGDPYSSFRMGRTARFLKASTSRLGNFDISFVTRLAKCSHGESFVIQFWAKSEANDSLIWGGLSVPNNRHSGAHSKCTCCVRLNCTQKHQLTEQSEFEWKLGGHKLTFHSEKTWRKGMHKLAVSERFRVLDSVHQMEFRSESASDQVAFCIALGELRADGFPLNDCVRQLLAESTRRDSQAGYQSR